MAVQNNTYSDSKSDNSPIKQKLKNRRAYDARTLLAVLLVLLLVFGFGVQYQSYLSGVKPSVAEAANIVAAADFEDEKPESDIIICLAGELAHQGYYRLSDEVTMREILDFAGVKADGDISEFDMSHKIVHGDSFYVRSSANPLDITPWLTNGLVVSESQDDLTVDEADVAGLVNLNTATEEELTTLPNIGEVKAKAIVEYRKEHNGFSCKEDLMGVDGIGQKTYEQLMDKVTV